MNHKRTSKIHIFLLIFSFFILNFNTQIYAQSSKYIYGGYWRLDKSTNKFEVIPELQRISSIFTSTPLAIDDKIYFCYTDDKFDLSHTKTSSAKLATINSQTVKGRTILSEGVQGPNLIDIASYKDGYLYCSEGNYIFRIKPNGTERTIIHKEEPSNPLNIIAVIDEYVYYNVTVTTFHANGTFSEKRPLYRKNMKTNTIELLNDNAYVSTIVKSDTNDSLYFTAYEGIWKTDKSFKDFELIKELERYTYGGTSKIEKIEGNNLYYSIAGYNVNPNRLVQLNLDTKEEAIIINQLISGPLNYVLFQDNFIYYINDKGINRLNRQSNEDILVYKSPKTNLTFINQF